MVVACGVLGGGWAGLRAALFGGTWEIGEPESWEQLVSWQ